jgi:hypothetical protein
MVRVPVHVWVLHMCVQLDPLKSGWALAGQLASSGSVDASEFGEWWLVEDGVAALVRFVVGTFAGATLTERHGLHAR